MQEALADRGERRCSIEPDEYVGVLEVHGVVILPRRSRGARIHPSVTAHLSPTVYAPRASVIVIPVLRESMPEKRRVST